MSHNTAVMPSDCCRGLGWEAATERMLDAGTIHANEWPGAFSTAQEAMLWSVYNSFIGGHTIPLISFEPQSRV